MRIARKVYMSIFTTMFILITCVATTFAWVGMFTTSTLGSFDLNLKVVDIDAEYYLKISIDGRNDSFGDEVNSIDIKRQILLNMGYETSNILDSGIETYFASKAIMEPVTTDKTLSEFYSISNLKYRKPFLSSDKRYFKFDLYFSIVPFLDNGRSLSDLTFDELNALDIDANVFFDNIETAINGTANTGSLINDNPFSTIPSNSEFACLKNINPRKITVNTKNAIRLAFQTYDPIPINSSYNGTELPNNTIIYQGGKQLPNVVNNVYDLGGILPEEYNLALKEINTIYNLDVNLDTLYVDTNGDGQISNSEKIGYTGAKERYDNNTDLEMVESNNQIWSSNSIDKYLGFKNGIQTKMKITVYFWYEGFDSDCLRLVDFRPTTFGLVLSSDKKIDNENNS